MNLLSPSYFPKRRFSSATRTWTRAAPLRAVPACWRRPWTRPRPCTRRHVQGSVKFCLSSVSEYIPLHLYISCSFDVYLLFFLPAALGSLQLRTQLR